MRRAFRAPDAREDQFITLDQAIRAIRNFDAFIANHKSNGNGAGRQGGKGSRNNNRNSGRRSSGKGGPTNRRGKGCDCKVTWPGHSASSAEQRQACDARNAAIGVDAESEFIVVGAERSSTISHWRQSGLRVVAVCTGRRRRHESEHEYQQRCEMSAAAAPPGEERAPKATTGDFRGRSTRAAE